MGNALGLARRNWLRLLAIGFMISLTAGIIVFGTNLGAQLAVRWSIRAAGSVDHLLLFDIAQGLGYGIRLMVFISIASAAYHLLQRAKYGGLPGEMARVFD